MLTLQVAASSLALAADISGKWTADFTGPDGTARVQFGDQPGFEMTAKRAAN